MKRLFSILLALVMIFSMLPATVFAAAVVDSGTCGNNLTWALDSAGKLTISGTGWMTSCPWASSHTQDITSVVVEEGAQYIYKESFSGCTNLTSVSLPESLLQIGEGAFRNCTGLTAIDLPAGLNYTEANAFSNTSIREITLPAIFRELDGREFTGCSQLENIWVEEGNKYYASVDGVLFDADLTTLVQYPTGRSGNYTMPENVTYIGYCAFETSTGLTGVELSSDCITIGSYAFRDCTGLSSITIPASVYNIYDGAFAECTALKEIIFEGDAPYFDADAFDGITATAYYDNRNDTWTDDMLQDYCGSITWQPLDLPQEPEVTVSSGTCGSNLRWTLSNYGTLTISGTGPMGNPPQPWEAYAQDITSVIIESGVTTIGERAFLSCTYLKEITIPNSVTSIGSYAFDGAGLTSLTIPDSVTSIGSNAFEDCDSLPSIVLPDSITTISEGLFSNCDALVSITIPNSVTVIDDEAFSSCYALTGISIPDSVTTIGNDAFIYCFNLKQIEIPASVTSIGTYAFKNCSALTSAMFSGNLTTISEGLFNGCSSLTDVFIPEGITSIGNHAFRECTSLNSVVLPDSLISIGKNAFSMCGNLAVIELPAKLLSIGNSAFYECTAIDHITIPRSCTSIGSLAFAYCDGMTDMYFPGSVPEIDDSAFYYSTFNAHYYEKNSSWTTDVMLDYGGTITWLPYVPDDNEGAWDDYVNTILKLEDEPFNYHSVVEDRQVEYTFDYDESWFFDSSDKYNHDLARMSIRMAMAAARTSDVSIVDLFDTLGFNYVNNSESDTDITNGDSVLYPSPTRDTIGFAIGSKKIQDGSGKIITLIAVAVRGGGYESEWANNFVIGTGTEHQGFSDAASKVVSAIQSYINEHNIDSEIRIWMTGYSRAAATSNIAAHNLNALAREGSIPGLQADGIYAYCFECPRTVRNTHPQFNADDSNIFNIVNPIDFVPMVAMRKWQFDRFGVTYYLPSNELQYYGINDGYAKMKEAYQNILDGIGSDTSVGLLTSHSWTQHTDLEYVVDTMANHFGSQYKYVTRYQATVSSALESLTGGSFSLDAVMYTLLGTLRDFTEMNPKAAAKLTSNITNIYYAHIQELCMAWMDALDGSYLWEEPTTRYLMVNCPVDVSVYDSDGILVAQITDDEVQEIAGSTIGALVDDNGQKTVILPLDAEFSIEFTATGDGTMSWQIQERDLDGGSAVRVLNYYDVDIEQSDIITGIAGAENNSADVEYVFFGTDGSGIAADSEITGDQVTDITLHVDSEGSGTATGGGYFVAGEFAQVSAVSDDGAEFLGWYVNDTLLSTETEYRFRMERDTVIIGKFSDGGITGDLNGDGMVDDLDVALLLWHTLFPESYEIAGDADFNGDGAEDDLDVAYLLWHTLFPDSYPL